jgi:hypothetical protein
VEALKMDDRGQMILLAALAVSVCLILLAMYLISIENAEAMEGPWLGSGTLENVIWAQDEGLEHAAMRMGNCSWTQRQELVNNFKSSADPIIDSISFNMLKHGIAFSFWYNDTLADSYVAGDQEASSINIGGVIIRQKNNATRICGCAYDVSVADGSAQYSLSRVVTWG